MAKMPSFHSLFLICLRRLRAILMTWRGDAAALPLTGLRSSAALP
jgi:hypothetical protein